MDCSEATVHSRPFSKFVQKILAAESFFWSNCRLTVQSSDYLLKRLHSGWTLQKQLSTAIHFQKFLHKKPVVESIFWSYYRLAVKTSNYIPKWLYQKCFLGNLPKVFGAPKCHRLHIFEVNLFLGTTVTSCRCRTFASMKQIFPRIIFFFS